MAKPAANTYTTLRTQIAHLLTEGRERAERAVERERVRTYSEIGKLIHEHVLSTQDRADYGDQLITRLAQDLNIGKTQLYEARAFYQAGIFLTSGKLVWSHYVELLKLPDPKRQKQLANRASQNSWTVRELRATTRSVIRPKLKRFEKTSTKYLYQSALASPLALPLSWRRWIISCTKD